MHSINHGNQNYELLNNTFKKDQQEENFKILLREKEKT